MKFKLPRFFHFSNIDPPREFPSDYIGDPSITYFDDGGLHVPLICKVSLFHGIEKAMNVTYMVQWFANGVLIKHGEKCSGVKSPCPSVDYLAFRLKGKEYKIGQMVSHWVESYFIQYMATSTNPCWALNLPCIAIQEKIMNSVSGFYSRQTKIEMLHENN